MLFLSLLLSISLTVEASDRCEKMQKEKIGPCFDGQNIGIADRELVNLDLSGTSFLSSNQKRTTFRQSSGHGLSFKESYLSNFKMEQSDFSDADFRGVHGFRWDLDTVKFDRVNFSGARIERSRWVGVQIRDSKFDATYIADSVFENCSYPKGAFAKAILINVQFVRCKEE